MTSSLQQAVEMDPAAVARETARHELRSRLHTLVADHTELPDYGKAAGIAANYNQLASMIVSCL